MMFDNPSPRFQPGILVHMFEYIILIFMPSFYGAESPGPTSRLMGVRPLRPPASVVGEPAGLIKGLIHANPPKGLS